MPTHLALLLTFGLAALGVFALAATPTDAEIRRARAWADARFGSGAKPPTGPPPFSFVYGDRPSADLLKSWTVVAKTRRVDSRRTETTVSYTDPVSGLVATCIATRYRDFPTIEWTLRFKNAGKADSPILSDVRPLDLDLLRRGADEFKLHWNTPDNTTQDSYRPHGDAMAPNAVFEAASVGGRPTTGGYPYWNVEFDDGGAIVVLSWGGQWSARFARDAGQAFHLQGGQELTRFVLHPGEEVSSPTAIVQLYEGDWIRGQNVWRRWMLNHGVPKVKGKVAQPFTYGCDGEFNPGLRTNLAGEKRSVAKFVEQRLAPMTWDVDAGWYPCDPNVGWPVVGTWEPDKERYPGGLKALSDFLHTFGIKLILWFEPERVAAGTWLAQNRPEWIYGGADGGLIRLGEPAPWKWIVERVSGLIASEGVDVYRQDFNIAPLGYWRGNDAPDRQGISEIRHVEGYYAFWDELRRRHPHLLIDTCASGGRRNNLETLRRSVPILRSDYTVEPIGLQGHTYGMAMWVPIFGTGQYTTSLYALRSAMCPIFGIGGDVVKNDINWDLGRQASAEWRQLSRCMMGDYYPLTPYSIAKSDWIAWQFDLSDKGEGMVQAFRRDECKDSTLTVRLRGLDPEATYQVTSFDTKKREKLSGKALMAGLTVTATTAPGSVLVGYKKLK